MVGDLTDLGRQVKLKRILEGKTAKGLAAEFGISIYILAKLENGCGDLLHPKTRKIAYEAASKYLSIPAQPIQPKSEQEKMLKKVAESINSRFKGKANVTASVYRGQVMIRIAINQFDTVISKRLSRLKRANDKQLEIEALAIVREFLEIQGKKIGRSGGR